MQIGTYCIELNHIFSVDDVEKAGITGLKGIQYLDKTLPDTPNLTEQREKVRIERGIWAMSGYKLFCHRFSLSL